MSRIVKAAGAEQEGATPMTAGQVDFYQGNGYLLVKGLMGRAEAAGYRREAHALIGRLQKIRNVDATWGAARQMSAEKTQLLHCHDVQFQSAAFSRLIVDDRITSVAAAIIGGPSVELHHTQILITAARKGSPFPLHQDCPFTTGTAGAVCCPTSRRAGGTCPSTAIRWRAPCPAPPRPATSSSSAT